MIKNFNLSPHNTDNFISKVKALDLSQGYVASVTLKKQTRSLTQNNLLWAVLTQISNQLELSGKKYSPEAWHEYFKQLFMPELTDELEELVKNHATYQKWDYLPNGSRILKASTTELTTKGFSEYMEQIYAFSSIEGVMFENN